jgi:quercetin dioxygenase-like cupin family protein
VKGIAAGLLAVAILTGACGSSTSAGARPTDSLTPLLQQPLTGVPGKTFTSAIVDLPANAKSLPHRHGQAFAYAYVLEGSIRSQLEGEAVKTYDQGQSWVEPPGAHHVLAENPSTTQPTKLLVVFIADDGTALKTDDPH